MKFLWLDMEMSGLEPDSCRILEVAAIITDENFQSLASYEAIVFQPPAVLNAMDPWCTEQHGKSGLTAAVAQGKKEELVESELLAWIDQFFTQEEKPILCGNSISQDRKFIDFYWKKLAKRLHYRMLDVSSWKIIFNQKFNVVHEKKGGHRALADIEESIAELQKYLSFVKID